ncbi:hypothetical protein Acr_27g0008140 [Actinidia rufa]|uniref:Uncharacterized protein n=1 Tax=Actinidia rufa TaxID=165716 RepID=A0A7J0H804_9ERIC|nr:hypothetical protein Acr_27g0008140 [Actinidia rufa]
MSEASRDLGASAEPNNVGPDCFAFYTHEVAELLSQDDDFLPFSSETSELVGRMSGVIGDGAISRHNYNGKDKIVLGSLFCNPTGARLSDIKKERLKALLRQSVIALSQEVDEMLDPVLGIRRLQSHLKHRKSLSNYSGVVCEGDTEQHPQKKIKLSASISISPHASPASSISAEDSDSESSDANLPTKVISNGVTKSNAHCHTTETSKWGSGPEGPEVNDDLQFLLENDAVKVEESIKKHSDELSTTVTF